MTLAVSVIIPACNEAHAIGHCLRALANQSVARETYEVIVIDDGSVDSTARVVEKFPARLLRQSNRGAPAARNLGILEARGRWTAFTDADCIPSRKWIEHLLKAVENRQKTSIPPLGAAGRTVGYGSETAAARFVDLSGGLDSERHLAHPKYPFAVLNNVMYLRESLLSVGGLDPRYHTYDACDLYTRLMRKCPGLVHFEPKALVLHRHRPTWRAYWRQQLGYGKGLGQFYWHYRKEIPWHLRRETLTWAALIPRALALLRRGEAEEILADRGQFVKDLAQRIGFASTYWNRGERKRWG